MIKNHQNTEHNERSSAFNPYLPHEVEIVDRIQNSPTIFTLRLCFTDPVLQQHFKFNPGQFNMMYLYGVGEVPISIVSDPTETILFDHTIRTVGRVTRALSSLKIGDRLGIRGPYGRGWPVEQLKNRDVIIITGGLGCAPSVSVINYIIERRNQYGNLKILQGVKHSYDFIFHEQYEKWREIPNTEVYVAANTADSNWQWKIGHITDTIQKLVLEPKNTCVLLCGPEIMMQIAIQQLMAKNISESNIFLSMERNMECAVGHCGHCQYGALFVCKQGPIFCYSEIKALFYTPGF